MTQNGHTFTGEEVLLDRMSRKVFFAFVQQLCSSSEIKGCMLMSDFSHSPTLHRLLQVKYIAAKVGLCGKTEMSIRSLLFSIAKLSFSCKDVISSDLFV